MPLGEIAEKISGAVISVIGGYSGALISGAVISNVVSGSVVLHTVTVNQGASGYSCFVYDSCSGVGGKIIAQPYWAGIASMPTTLLFDQTLSSGLVIATSGTSWNLTVTYKQM